MYGKKPLAAKAKYKLRCAVSILRVSPIRAGFGGIEGKSVAPYAPEITPPHGRLDVSVIGIPPPWSPSSVDRRNANAMATAIERKSRILSKVAPSPFACYHFILFC